MLARVTKHKKTFAMAAAFIFLLAVINLFFPYGDKSLLVIKTSTGKEYNFNVEIAANAAAWEKGLMFRKYLGVDDGMLFKFNDNAVRSFWMKNTYIPLDIIFIDENGEIKKISENAKPLSLDAISSDVPVKAVLEINGGLSSKLGIKRGDKAVYPLR